MYNVYFKHYFLIWGIFKKVERQIISYSVESDNFRTTGFTTVNLYVQDMSTKSIKVVKKVVVTLNI
jgi:hypothetical protein